jgi:hypothetical protein
MIGVIAAGQSGLVASQLLFLAQAAQGKRDYGIAIRPTALVKSHGHVSLKIYGVDAYADTTGEVGTTLHTASTVLHSWDEEETNQVRLDFKFDLESSGSVSMNLDHSLVYYLFVEAQVGVHSVGWPGSLAGSKLSITVPSIAYDYHLHPVLQQ